MNRRDALATGALGLLAVPALAQDNAPKPPKPLPGWDEGKGEYVLPPLPYPKEALEPHIDAQTMDIHHTKHHAAYVAGLNKALKELRNVRSGGDAALIKHWSREVSFHGSGHINHTLFWNMMAPPGKGGGGQPSGKLAAAIERDFGAFDQFLAHFKAAAGQVEGGGWAWLVYEPLAKQLVIIQEEKQQDMMLTGARPILGIDVWEHAYYLKYQNRRSDYVTGFFNVVNWGFCQTLFDQATA
jgi:Fe-Mn family superoxide dismutase